MKPTEELKDLFKELVEIETFNYKRRDWAIIKLKGMYPFNVFKLKDLIK
jgi:hypothetical protein